MLRGLTRCVVGVLVACFSTAAFAQKINQPWTSPRGSHESRVISCANPTPAAGWSVALDDWICPSSGTITRVQWWGVVSNAAQLQRRWYVAIWNHDAALCRPGTARLYQACVTVNTVAVGNDCQGRVVYRFSASLPAPYFTQTQGQHYWLQVSEIDADSIQAGAQDFRWSSHLPVMNCNAVRRNSAFVVTQPISDDCPQPTITDLAFRLYGGVVVVGTIVHPALPARSVFMMTVRDTSGAVRETIPIEPAADGRFEAELDSPQGVYEIEILGMGLSSLMTMAALQEGENQINLPPGCLDGDITHDGNVDQDDISRLINAIASGQCP